MLKKFLENIRMIFYYYGSRVKGDFIVSSDLDILLKNVDIVSYGKPEKIKEEFNKSKIPFIVYFSLY